jgi:hypothetical protein
MNFPVDPWKVKSSADSRFFAIAPQHFRVLRPRPPTEACLLRKEGFPALFRQPSE